MFCTTSAIGISLQHLNYPNLFIRNVYRFHGYFHTIIILHHSGIPLLHDHGFKKVKNSYNKSAYYSICDDYSVTADEIWINDYWFYTLEYDFFSDGTKAAKRFPLDKLTL